MDILSIIQSLTADDGAKRPSITHKSSSALGEIAKVAAPMILMGLFKNSKQTGAASSLLSALSDHERTDQVDAVTRINQSDTQDGLKILNHIFGDDTAKLTDQIAAKAGVEHAEAEGILASLAPVIMESLADKTKTQRSAENLQATILNELRKVDDEPSMPDLSRTIRQERHKRQLAEEAPRQGGIADLLNSVFGGDQMAETDQSGGLLDTLGGSDVVGSILGNLLKR